MYDVVSIGSATQDVFVSSPQTQIICLQTPDCEQTYLAFEYGAKVMVDHLFVSTGGGATNTAIALARLGLRPGIVCEIGQDDAGEMVERALHKAGVDCSMIIRNPQRATGYSVIITGFTGDRTALCHRGAARSLSHKDVNWDLLCQTQWIYLASLAGDSARLWQEVAAFSREHSIKLAINPGAAQTKLGLAGLREVLQTTEVIFVNKREAYEITGMEEKQGDEDEREAMAALYEAGCRLVVMTMGKAGAFAYDGNEHYKIPARGGRPLCTLGAGDAFGSGCLAGLLHGLTVPDALQAGAINAGSVVCALGATEGLCTWDKIQEELT